MCTDTNTPRLVNNEEQFMVRKSTHVTGLSLSFNPCTLRATAINSSGLEVYGYSFRVEAADSHAEQRLQAELISMKSSHGYKKFASLSVWVSWT